MTTGLLFPAVIPSATFAGESSPRDIGTAAAAACEAKAERETGFDGSAAADVILGVLRSATEPVSGEALVDAAKAAGHVPHDDRAYGAVVSRLVRAGQIRAVGYGSRSKGHGTAGARLWVYAGGSK